MNPVTASIIAGLVSNPPTAEILGPLEPEVRENILGGWQRVIDAALAAAAPPAAPAPPADPAAAAPAPAQS
jgi:hypothetical protein